jgi:cytochrome c
MRASASIAMTLSATVLSATVLVAATMLASCSKPSASADAGGGAPLPAPAAPSGLTDAQKKALLASLPTPYQAADLDNGQSKFAICKGCHTFAKGGETMVGPNLWGVFGRKAGGVPGFAYSAGLKALGGVWDADRLNTWITRPSAMVPGTKMTYAGMENPKDRVDVIAYLKTVTSPAAP